jgi:hypothetical protein
MPSDRPIRLSEAVVDPFELKREYLVLVAIAVVCVFIASQDPSIVSIGVAVVAGLFVGFAVVAALPGSLRLRVDDDGLDLRAFFLLRRRIPWSAIAAIDVAEGWQGETVAVEVTGDADAGTIIGLPVDPGLGRRAFATTFGLEPAALCALLGDRREAAVSGPRSGGPSQ